MAERKKNPTTLGNVLDTLAQREAELERISQIVLSGTLSNLYGLHAQLLMDGNLPGADEIIGLITHVNEGKPISQFVGDDSLELGHKLDEKDGSLGITDGGLGIFERKSSVTVYTAVASEPNKLTSEPQDTDTLEESFDFPETPEDSQDASIDYSQNAYWVHYMGRSYTTRAQLKKLLASKDGGEINDSSLNQFIQRAITFLQEEHEKNFGTSIKGKGLNYHYNENETLLIVHQIISLLENSRNFCLNQEYYECLMRKNNEEQVIEINEVIEPSHDQKHFNHSAAIFAKKKMNGE